MEGTFDGEGLIEEVILIYEGAKVVEGLRVEGEFVGEDLPSDSKVMVLLVGEEGEECGFA